jgi:hypothetical protein
MAENFGTSSRVVSITVRGGTPQTNQPDLLGLTAGDEDSHRSGDEGDEHGPDGDEHHGLGDAHELLEADSGFSSVEVDDVGGGLLLTRTVPCRVTCGADKRRRAPAPTGPWRDSATPS